MSLNNLKTIIEFNRAQPTIEAECLANNECPDCAWTLKVNSVGEKSCPICEKVYK
jgi:uncharacterized Zn finger protein (UPF0148 family)